MRHNLQNIITASTTSLLVLSASAQNATIPTVERPEYTGQNITKKANPPLANRLNGAAKCSDVVGMAVKNYQGETLGKVEDIAVDLESGRIVQVIISTGGFLGAPH